MEQQRLLNADNLYHRSYRRLCKRTTKAIFYFKLKFGVEFIVALIFSPYFCSNSNNFGRIVWAATTLSLFTSILLTRIDQIAISSQIQMITVADHLKNKSKGENQSGILTSIQNQLCDGGQIFETMDEEASLKAQENLSETIQNQIMKNHDGVNKLLLLARIFSTGICLLGIKNLALDLPYLTRTQLFLGVSVILLQSAWVLTLLLLTLLLIVCPLYIVFSEMMVCLFKKSLSPKIKLPPSEKMKYNAYNSECAICFQPHLQDQTIVRLPCFQGHIFHSQCLNQWFRTSANTCPICRQEFETA